MNILTDYKALVLSSVSQTLITPKIEKYLTHVYKRVKEKKLANTEDFKELAGQLFDYNLVTNELKCGGHCTYWKKEIGFTYSISREWNQKAICHEFGHAIQAEVEHFEKREYLLSFLVNEEQQAETIAYKLSRIIFPATPIHHSKFNTYFSIDDLVFLNNWYREWIDNDLLKEDS